MGGGEGKHDDSFGGEGGGISVGGGGSGACSSPLESHDTLYTSSPMLSFLTCGPGMVNCSRKVDGSATTSIEEVAMASSMLPSATHLSVVMRRGALKLKPSGKLTALKALDLLPASREREV